MCIAAGTAFASDAPAATVIDGGTVMGPAEAPPSYGFDTDGAPILVQPDAGSLAGTRRDDAWMPPAVEIKPVTVSQLMAPVASPFEGATLAAGLHSRDRQSYPRAGSSTAAEFELIYRF